METKDIISIVTISIGLIVTAINIIFAGKIRNLTLQVENKFRQQDKISDKAIEPIQNIIFSLRKLKEIYRHINYLAINNEDPQEIKKKLEGKFGEFADKFITSFSLAEMFLNKSLRKRLYDIEHAVTRPSTNPDKVKIIISDIEHAIDDICKLTHQIYFPSIRELFEK